MKTVFLLALHTEEARQWTEENINYESWNTMGKNIAVEHRYIEPIVEGLLEAGFENDKDFSIS